VQSVEMRIRTSSPVAIEQIRLRVSVAQSTYTQDTRQLLHFRCALVSFRSRFCAKGWRPGCMVAVYRNPFQIEARKLLSFNGPFWLWCLSN
jgi:hypothetical protein